MMDAKRSLLNALKKVAEEQKYAEFTASVQRISDGTLTSTLFHVTLCAAGKPDLKLFAKVAAMPVTLRTRLSPSPYNSELYFYTTLQSKFEKLEEKHSVPVEYRLRTPKLYGSSEEFPNETLVLEDLDAQGFQNFEKRHSADMEHMSTGIELMAQFHALSAAYHKDASEDFKRTKDLLAIDDAKMETFFMTIVYDKFLSNAYATAEGEHRARLEKYFKEPNKLREILNIFRNYNKNILVHGDFKPSNLMYRRRNGKLEITVVDFQKVHDGDPVGDLMYFIFTATDEKFRREHYQALLDLYYQRLKAALVRVNINSELFYPETAYRAQLEESKMLGLVMAVTLLPAVLAEGDVDFAEDKTTSHFVPKAGALFKERFNGVLNNYVEWGLL